MVGGEQQQRALRESTAFEGFEDLADGFVERPHGCLEKGHLLARRLVVAELGRHRDFGAGGKVGGVKLGGMARVAVGLNDVELEVKGLGVPGPLIEVASGAAREADGARVGFGFRGFGPEHFGEAVAAVVRLAAAVVVHFSQARGAVSGAREVAGEVDFVFAQIPGEVGVSQPHHAVAVRVAAGG